MRRLMQTLIPSQWYTRKCRGCWDGNLHTHHMTWLGKVWLWANDR